MNDELKYLAGRAAQGRVSRRAFMGRAAALGISAGMAGNMLASAVSAQGAVKGGTLLSAGKAPTASIRHSPQARFPITTCTSSVKRWSK